MEYKQFRKKRTVVILAITMDTSKLWTKNVMNPSSDFLQKALFRGMHKSLLRTRS